MAGLAARDVVAAGRALVEVDAARSPLLVAHDGGHALPTSDHPRMTRTRCFAPSSSRGIESPATVTPSSSSRARPRVTPAGFSTAISYRAVRYRKTMVKPRHARGTHGSKCNVEPCTRKPRIHSRPARYIHPAEPVYHVHPPRPRCGARE